MNIAIIVPSLYMGGGEKFACDLANDLVKNKNNQITLCVISKIHQEMMLLHRIHRDIKIISMEKGMGFDYKTLFKVRNFLKANKFDVVHTHLRGIRYTAWSMISFRQTKYIHTFHTLVEKEASSLLYKKFLRFSFNYLNVVPVAISPAVLEGMQNFFGSKHTNMILNGVSILEKSSQFEKVQNEISAYKINNATKVFINVARVTEVKNQKLLIETFKKINTNTILLIVGSLDNEPSYAQECQELAKSSKNIFFLGEKDNVGDYLYCADALCLSSIFEGLPLVILEAMSIGKPTLSTNVGGIPHVIIDTKTGYLTKNMSYTSYINIIHTFIEHSSINNEEIYSIFQEKYSMNICASQYYNLYQKIQDNI